MLGTQGTADYQLYTLTESISIIFFALQCSVCLGTDQDGFHLISSFKVLPVAGSCIK